jgi:hypothetical protein
MVEVTPITPPGQEGWLCQKEDIAKQPLTAQTGWLTQIQKLLDPPPRPFGPPLLARGYGGAHSDSFTPFDVQTETGSQHFVEIENDGVRSSHA